MDHNARRSAAPGLPSAGRMGLLIRRHPVAVLGIPGFLGQLMALPPRSAAFGASFHCQTARPEPLLLPMSGAPFDPLWMAGRSLPSKASTTTRQHGRPDGMLGEQ